MVQPSYEEVSNIHQNSFHWAETQKDGKTPSFSTRANDPYTYQAGFNNCLASEAIPGTLPQGQNSPRQVRFGLYAEQLTGSAFVAPRPNHKAAWVYRMRPAVSHKGFTDASELNRDYESCFLPLNPNVHVSPTQLAWLPFDIPTSGDTDFTQGLKTIAGAGDPSLREGLATHMFLCNKSMDRKAFVNLDGEMLIVPQQGRLDIQSEFGWLYVQPGEICVIPRGIRFSVNLPDGPTRGYILEIWGSSFELPELGPLGGFGLANARDFLFPSAYYEIDSSPNYEIVYKVGGKFFKSYQDHTPYDVVAWSGNYVPYKYDLTKFVNVGSISVDHIDPSIFCVLTAKSRDPTAPLADFLIFSPRWDVASNTYRPPYYHRNVASELMGLIYGDYGGRSDAFQPGGVSFETGMTPHGVAYEEFKAASDAPPPEMQISKGAIAFMFESCRAFTVAEYGWTSDKLHFHDHTMWDDLVNNFTSHLDEVKRLTNGNWEHGVNVARAN
ncbi:homogentisate 1,2-dioxygenase-like protein [Lipomyces arxii]|uniref:homogentisate 1,2-dioxygenase-like protein n=1 Tax=Lipomyces arxii TaxID=56418 RepID=UPI0034CE7418